MPRKPQQTTHDLRQLNKNGANKWNTSFKLESRGGLTWAMADPTLLRAALAAVTEDGAALLLGKTSDGGALTLYVLNDQGTHKMHPATASELTEGLQLVIEISSS